MKQMTHEQRKEIKETRRSAVRNSREIEKMKQITDEQREEIKETRRSSVRKTREKEKE